ncbi:GTP-binding protein drn-1 [Hydra vulgaris]|uniref:GTP-binding protein drn-1 n=1 Tax=Hydra vulgaris TaxID=6087 RepID=UPI00064117C5|nr:GTP-binding protein drn-1 [Hydra vulgaris]
MGKWGERFIMLKKVTGKCLYSDHCNGYQETACCKSLRVLVLGAPGVGKTSVLEQFLYGKFCSDYLPTVSEVYKSRVFIKKDKAKKEINLELRDFNGKINQMFTRLYREEVIKADAFIIVYSENSEQSFAKVVETVADINNIRNVKSPILILQNKKDLKSYEELSKYFYMINTKHAVVSAKDNKNIHDAFKDLILDLERDF